MAYENNNEFSEWLYNRYVETWRKGDITKAFVFSDILRVYIEIALKQRKFSKQKRRANELYKTIYKALQNKTTNKLLLTGQEGTLEFEKTIADYEAMLREMNCPEETMKDLIIEKRFNYGND